MIIIIIIIIIIINDDDDDDDDDDWKLNNINTLCFPFNLLHDLNLLKTSNEF